MGFFLLAVTAIAFALFAYRERPSQVWPIQPKTAFRILLHGSLHALHLLFWTWGLKFGGPIRSVFADFVEPAVVYLLLLALNQKESVPAKVNGAVLAVISFAIILWSDTFLTAEGDGDIVGDTAAAAAGDAADLVGDAATAATGAHEFNLWLIRVPEEIMGALALAASVLFSVLRKTIARTVPPADPAHNALASLSLAVVLVFFIPFGLTGLFTYTPSASATKATASLIGAPFIGASFSYAAFILASDWIVETRVGKDGKVEPGLLVRFGFVVSFIFVVLVNFFWEVEEVTILTILCAGAMFAGLRMMLTDDPRSGLGGGSAFGAFGSSVGAGVMPTYESSGDFSLAGLGRGVKMLWDHVQGDTNSYRIFMFLTLNFAFMFVELIYGFWSNSLGLISDAAHMAFDCVSLGIGLYGAVVSKWKATESYSYGFGRFELLSGFMNAVLLIFVSLYVFLESYERLRTPPEIDTENLLLVSVLGFILNIIGLIWFHDAAHGHSHDHDHDHGHSHNMEGVFLHVLADTLGSVGVIISALLIQWKGWVLSDPICSLFIGGLIFLSVVPLLKQSSALLMQRVPPQVEAKLAKALLGISKLDGVASWSDPHVWDYSEEAQHGTITVRANEDAREQSVLASVQGVFKANGLKHMTVQVTKEAFYTATRAKESQTGLTSQVLVEELTHAAEHDHGHDHHDHDHGHGHHHAH